MNKLLIICGPTATGKTSLTLHLAKQFNGELVSADSRQVYRRMDIGTGKDLPVNAKLQMANVKWGKGRLGWYGMDEVKVWGLDIVDPGENFSVAEYIEIAGKVITDIWERGNLPILVGGTGFYIRGIVDGIGTLEVPRNKVVREELEGKAVEELYEELEGLDEKRAQGMNKSDRRNPARLVRAIEVGRWRKDKGGLGIIGGKGLAEETDVLFIGLTAPKDLLNKRIEKRVEERMRDGVIGEIKGLLEKGVTWETQAMNAMGYREWKAYFTKATSGKEKISEGEIIENWKRDEKNYAKRQMTWFKKDIRVHWFDITEDGYPVNVVKTVEKWHT